VGYIAVIMVVNEFKSNSGQITDSERHIAHSHCHAWSISADVPLGLANSSLLHGLRKAWYTSPPGMDTAYRDGTPSSSIPRCELSSVESVDHDLPSLSVRPTTLPNNHSRPCCIDTRFSLVGVANPCRRSAAGLRIGSVLRRSIWGSRMINWVGEPLTSVEA